jgi:hypothetical protein
MSIGKRIRAWHGRRLSEKFVYYRFERVNATSHVKAGMADSRRMAS